MICRAWSRALRLVESNLAPSAATAPPGITSAPLALCWVALAPWPASGAFRYLTSASMLSSLIIALCASLALLALWWPVRDRRPKSGHVWGSAALWWIIAWLATAAMLVSSYGLTQTVLSPVLGGVADRYGFEALCVVIAVLPMAGAAVIHTTLKPKPMPALAV